MTHRGTDRHGRSNFNDKPDNQFVAGFIGSPAMNFLKGKVKSNGSASFEGPNGVKLPLARRRPIGRAARGVRRPAEHFHADDGAEAEIVVVEPTGSETQVFAKLGGEQVVAVSANVINSTRVTRSG